MAQSLACKSHECPQCELRLQHLDMVVRVRYGPKLDFAKSASFPILQFLKGADREAFVASAAAV